MKILLATLFTLLLIACGSTSTTKVDYNEQTNFSLFKSFQFIKKINTDMNANPVMDNRIKNAIESALILQLLTPQEELADLQVNFHIVQQEKTNNSSFSIGLGGAKVGGRGAASVGLSTSIPIDSNATIVTTVFIDINHNNETVWHGTDFFEGKGDMYSQEKKQAITETVNRLLLNFPPKKVLQQK